MRALLLLLAVLTTGCFNVSTDGERVEGSGTEGRRTVDADGVREVRLAAPGTLVITPGAAPLVIEGDDNLVDRLEVEVDDGELSIQVPPGASFRLDRPLRMRIGVERLEGVEVAGSGRVEASDVQTDDLDAAIAGAGALALDGLRAEAVDVRVAGSGDVTLSGRAGRLDVEIAGSGDVDASGLAAGEASVSVAGSGDVTVRVEKALDVEIMGSGDVHYFGSPTVSRRVMGSGDVSRRGD
ncbi:head GIN domain-containing protein [Rubrivirga marina]|uniref:Putative auto-transporter adhesin head GIN domain-containing protein n=1 Tax=Rubrivirga marina TaxID=1196024 RepID=A0A271IYI1_9BACT|nr:head GIN domain-containing protein [Rubrivirga marina]PAP76273.1 hypothetical protein BSZ37_07350 [Rubrivirga marina]